jgi:hypothetical protein
LLLLHVPGTGNFASLAPPTFVQRAQQEAARASEKLSFGGYPNPVVAEKKGVADFHKRYIQKSIPRPIS